MRTLIVVIITTVHAFNVQAKTLQVFLDSDFETILGFNSPDGATINAVYENHPSRGDYYGGDFQTVDFYAWNGSAFVFAADATMNSILNQGTDGAFYYAGEDDSANGVDGIVNDINATADYIYFGGIFDYGADASGTVYSPNCIRWDISNAGWDALYDSTYGGLNDEVLTIEIMGQYDQNPGHVYVGGRFTDVSGYSTADYLAKWSDPNPSWIPLDSGIQAAVDEIWFTTTWPYYDYATE